MIELGANFRLSGAPDYLVTLALLFIAGVALKRALSGVSPFQFAMTKDQAKLNEILANINGAIRFAWGIICAAPFACMAIAALALIASTLPYALERIGF